MEQVDNNNKKENLKWNLCSLEESNQTAKRRAAKSEKKERARIKKDPVFDQNRQEKK